jgi:hypothetical protein
MTITTEQAFDMLPYAVSIIEKLDMKGYILKNKELLNTKDKEAAQEKMDDKGFDFVMHILKNTGKVKTEVFEILAIVQGKSVEEVKAAPFGDIIKQLKILLKDTELMNFFKSAM